MGELRANLAAWGLGLSISQAAVTAHGGVIRAESDGLGHGATLVVKLPLLAIPG